MYADTNIYSQSTNQRISSTTTFKNTIDYLLKYIFHFYRYTYLLGTYIINLFHILYIPI